MDISTVITLAGASVVVAILVQIVKDWLTNDREIRVAALALGAVVVVLAGLSLGHSTPAQLGTDVVTGILAGASAVGLYHVQDGTILPPRG